MALGAGTRLGTYEILAPIGAGGMGEVYHARDTKLGRDVAVKVLPEEFSRDAERVARFEREAKLLASLNHANVATLFGLEASNEQQFLAMELVEGETLAERIARGPIPINEAIPLFIQIADALEAAHDNGVIHRDLKPANIKLTPDGRIKVLDFGLAKAFSTKENVPAGTSNSPTLTKGTALGTIIGTASYMSPEQARGRQVDKKTDLWAFGCCLYEALSGRKAFDGDNFTDILAAIVNTDPSWDRLPHSTPWRVRDVLERCLRKDAGRRFHDAADVRLELQEAPPEAHQQGARTRTPSTVLRLATGVAVVATVVALWALTRSGPSTSKPVIRSTISLPEGEVFDDIPGATSVAISPDGQHIAYVLWRGGMSRLYLRNTAELEAKAIDGGEDARMPFFSPDGQTLGFAGDGGTVMAVSVSGGAPITVARFDRARGPRGASWGADGTIVLNPGSQEGDGLHQISAEGAERKILALPSRERREKAFRFPEVLPGGKAVLFTYATGDIDSFDDASIAVLVLETSEVKVLLEGGSSPRYSSSGHIIYARAGTLLAVPFNESALEVTGAPVPILEGVSTSPTSGPAQFALTRGGSLIYAPGEPTGTDYRVVWVDRNGKTTPLIEAPRAYFHTRLSPDGRSLAVSVNHANMSLWVYDTNRGALTRLVSAFNNWNPIWTPDGTHVTFRSDAEGPGDIFTTAADGAGQPERLSKGAFVQIPESWSPDGRTLAYREFSEETGNDIWVLSLDGERAARPFLQSSANETYAAFSPNGRWIAYTSDESGQREVFIRSFPDPISKRQVSTEGGFDPLWNPNGRELFYRREGQVLAVETRSEGELVLGTPRLLFESDSHLTQESSYDVSPDGERFVMIDSGASAPPPSELVLVQNFAEELKRLVPSND